MDTNDNFEVQAMNLACVCVEARMENFGKRRKKNIQRKKMEKTKNKKQKTKNKKTKNKKNQRKLYKNKKNNIFFYAPFLLHFASRRSAFTF